MFRAPRAEYGFEADDDVEVDDRGEEKVVGMAAGGGASDRAPGVTLAGGGSIDGAFSAAALAMAGDGVLRVLFKLVLLPVKLVEGGLTSASFDRLVAAAIVAG